MINLLKLIKFTMESKEKWKELIGNVEQEDGTIKEFAHLEVKEYQNLCNEWNLYFENIKIQKKYSPLPSVL